MAVKLRIYQTQKEEEDNDGCYDHRNLSRTGISVSKLWLVCSRLFAGYSWGSSVFFVRLALCDHLSGTTHPKLNKALTIHLWSMGLCSSGWWITEKRPAIGAGKQIHFFSSCLCFFCFGDQTPLLPNLREISKDWIAERRKRLSKSFVTLVFCFSVFFSLPYPKNKTHSSLALLWQDDNFLLTGDVCMMAVDCRSAVFQVQSCIEHFGTDFEISWFTWDTLHVWPLNQRFYHIPSQALLKIKHCKWIAPLSLCLHRILYHFLSRRNYSHSAQWLKMIFYNKNLDAWNTKQVVVEPAKLKKNYALQNGLKVKIRKKIFEITT